MTTLKIEVPNNFFVASLKKLNIEEKKYSLSKKISN